jgi:predicted outer membrane repeat protein
MCTAVVSCQCVPAGRDGGGMVTLSDLHLLNTEFSNNSAKANGGSIRFDDGRLTVVNTTFTANTALLQGGALSVNAYCDATINSTVFTGNSAGTGAGGAVHTLSDTVLHDVVFQRNSAAYGAAVNFLYPGSLTARNSVFTDNAASVAGAAVLSDLRSPAAALTGSTFSGNSAFCCYAQSFANQTRPAGTACSDIDSRVTQLSDCCAAGSYSDGERCKLCSDELACEDIVGANTSTLQLASGLWRASSRTLTVYNCLNSDACSGGVALTSSTDSYCATGYKGPCECR